MHTHTDIHVLACTKSIVSRLYILEMYFNFNGNIHQLYYLKSVNKEIHIIHFEIWPAIYFEPVVFNWVFYRYRKLSLTMKVVFLCLS